MGAQTQTITVTEAPPIVDTSDAELGRTISPAEIIGLPLVNRNAYAELSLTPGVMVNSMSQQSNANGTPNFVIGLPSTDVQVNGSIDGGNPEVSFYLDGGLNINGIRNYGNQLPNPDALEEFRVETSDFSAQYGHMSAAVVTAVTKSGTNQLHGALFEFNRNTDFNAYNWNAPKDSNGNSSRLRTTATSSAESLAALSRRTRHSSSSAMAGCGRWLARTKAAAEFPRLPSARAISRAIFPIPATRRSPTTDRPRSPLICRARRPLIPAIRTPDPAAQQ